MIIIIGGNSGIGRTISESLRLQGDEVITISRSEIKKNNNHLVCDITSYDSLKNVYMEILKLNKSIHAVINCAGIASMNLALTTPPKITEQIIKTNLIGTIFSNQVFAPLLIRNKSGRIINFSTIAVPLGLKGESVYIASKAGVEAFTKVFAKELSSFNITVNCIAPGPIRTNLIKGLNENQIKNVISKQIIQKEMSKTDVFQIVQLLLQDNSSNITGQVINIGGV